MPVSVDRHRYPTQWYEGRGFRQAYVRLGAGGVPLLLIHGWPETKRLYWRVIEPLAEAGFDVIVPDLRGFGESALGPDGRHDAPASSRDLEALVTDGLGHRRVVVAGGDFGGVIAQDFALRFPDCTERLVLTNCPLPYDREAMAGLRTRPPRENLDYHLRQGTDADSLAAELASAAQRHRYVETFYTSRDWAHPGTFTVRSAAPGDYSAVDFHCEPFQDAARFRASLGAYEARYDEGSRSEPTMSRVGGSTRTLILFGSSDRVVAPDFDRVAAIAFPNHMGPFVLQGCGHFVPWEAPYAYVSAVTAFCSDLLAAAKRAAPTTAVHDQQLRDDRLDRRSGDGC
ncbi:alpha/beta hydrolase [Jatrophihabitans sp.]|uniref:alpha/beta fold hydrolase n=1 Tax=Jatrophihabitans sp. TaxID=1932789 RepID=UPI0030C72E06